MNQADQQLLSDVLSTGKGLRELQFVPVFRGEHLLLALPSDRLLAMATVSLYQPQKLKGRVFKLLLKIAVKTGVYQLFPKQSVTVGEKGVMSLLEEKSGERTLGFLLGGSESATRNLIGVIGSENSYYVVKAGCGEGIAVLREECGMTEEFSKSIEGVPKCLWGEEFYNGFAYLTELVKGQSPHGKGDEAKVFALLSRWLDVGLSQKMADLLPWGKLKIAVSGNARASAMVDGLGDLEVLASVMHGDFAPWNIKLTSGGEVKVLDWEFAVRYGVPSWDGIHYKVQQMKLVEGANAEEIYHECMKWMKSDSMQPYLIKSGLAGVEDDLFTAYCYYSELVLGYERADLIEIWERRVNGGA